MNTRPQEKATIPSQLDEVEAVLSAVPAPFTDIPPVTAFLANSPSSSPAPVLDWSALPAAVDADSTGMGVSTRKKAAYKPAKRPVDQAKVQARVARKRAQVESFLLVLQPVLQAAGHSIACLQQQQQQQQHSQPPEAPATALDIVDFGCGSGNLLLPLAALLPGCRFTGVDMKPAALQLLQKRAAAAGLSNVRVFEGMIEQYREPFDVGLALHACGNATDHVLQMCVERGAAFVVSPCCVGKLRFSLTGGSSFHRGSVVWTPSQPGDKPVHMRAQQGAAPQQRPPPPPQQQQQQHDTQQEQQQQSEPAHRQQQQQDAGGGAAAGAGAAVAPQLRHPRSDWLLSHLPDPERHFRIMAKVADMSHAPSDRAQLAEALQQRASVADACKRFVELDRCVAAAEAGYAVGLFKVLQADSMAKNDLLVGLPLPTTAAAPSPAAAGVATTATQAGSVSAAAAAGADSASAGLVQQGAGGAGDADASRQLSRLALGAAGGAECLCRCGQALCSSGVLFTKEALLGAACAK